MEKALVSVCVCVCARVLIQSLLPAWVSYSDHDSIVVLWDVHLQQKQGHRRKRRPGVVRQDAGEEEKRNYGAGCWSPAGSGG